MHILYYYYYFSVVFVQIRSFLFEYELGVHLIQWESH